jgi:uncharacterized coiled-coil DUF342 family protein
VAPPWFEDAIQQLRLDLRTDFRREIRQARHGLRNNIRQARNGLRNNIRQVRDDLHDEIEEVRNMMRTEIIPSLKQVYLFFYSLDITDSNCYS